MSTNSPASGIALHDGYIFCGARHGFRGRQTLGNALQYDEVGSVMENLEKLIVDLKDSLERELSGLRHDVQEGVGQLNGRFDTQAARLERHAGLWQTGARWSSRMDAWAEKVDAALEAKDRELADLRDRLQRLERRSA